MKVSLLPALDPQAIDGSETVPAVKNKTLFRATLAQLTAFAVARAEGFAAAAQFSAGAGEFDTPTQGLANTNVGDAFWCANGNSTGTIYRHDPGPIATPLQTFIMNMTAPAAARLIGATGGNVQQALDAKAPAAHGHSIAAVTGLHAALDGKAAASHGHTNLALGDASGATSLRVVKGGSFEAMNSFAVSFQTYASVAGQSGDQGGLYVQAGLNRGADIARFSSVGSGYVDVPRMVIKDTGQVGIGLSSPSYTLDVNSGPSDIVARFHSEDPGAYLDMRDNTTGPSMVLIGAVGNDLLFRLGGERMRITSTGRVGIGKASPDHQLDVSGGGQFGNNWNIQFNEMGHMIIFTRNGANYIDAINAGTLVYRSSYGHQFHVDGVERMRLDTSTLRVNGGAVLRNSNSGYGSADVTISRSAPSGGQNGDIWFKVP
ncbi:MAG: phage tail repeat domain-containing protein [Erythrobacter sp.]|nr:phage tail repeat domain-containing protein [Erythrobacter sp.]